MNMPAMSEMAPPKVPARAPKISPARRFYWTLRRELEENRSIYLVPLAVAVLIVIAAAVALLPVSVRLHAGALDPTAQREPVEAPFVFASLLLMFSTMVVGIFYSLDALYGERRDRSVLFWKSMPVSDTMAVLAKASVPLLVLPLVTFAVTLATQVIMLLLGLIGGGSGLWNHLGLLDMWGSEFFHLLAFHGLWWAPFWGWFLLASAWARRAPLLWATLPPLAIGFAEKIAFGSSHFAHWLAFRFVGSDNGPQGMSSRMLMPNSVWSYVSDLHLWTGFAMCAVFLALAIRLRRMRGPA